MNLQLVAATARWPNLVIADWSGRATPNPGLVYGDGLHLTPAGQAAMAELVAEQVAAFAQQVAPSTSTSTTAAPPVTSRPHRSASRHRHAGRDPSDDWVWVAVGAAGVAVVILVLATRPRRRRRAMDP